MSAPEGHSIYKDFGNPSKYRGYWLACLLLCVNARSAMDLKYACKLLRMFSEQEKGVCGKCAGHAAAFIKGDPPEAYTTDPYDLFCWITKMMNAVQLRNGNPLYNPAILHKWFTAKSGEQCTFDCDEQSTGSGVTAASKPKNSVMYNTTPYKRAGSSYQIVNNGLR